MPEKINLWNHRKIVTKQENPSLTSYLLNDGKIHPGILVIPGGGYGTVCEQSEGSPIAKKFNALGFHSFVLRYRVAPHAFPAPVQDALRAMKIIRGNAERWKIYPDRIASCGFSAGGHLACCLGTISEEVDANDDDIYDTVDGFPDAMILCYPVITFEPWSHCGSAKNFCGMNPVSREFIDRFSLEKRVSKKTPPAFLWHTIGDQMVCYRNSIVFAESMAQSNRPCELHLYPRGDHGMLLGIDTPVSSWPSLAKAFLRTQWKKDSSSANVERYTNSYQVGKIVKKYK